jgi:hypothetical protein
MIIKQWLSENRFLSRQISKRNSHGEETQNMPRLTDKIQFAFDVVQFEHLTRLSPLLARAEP